MLLARMMMLIIDAWLNGKTTDEEAVARLVNYCGYREDKAREFLQYVKDTARGKEHG